MNNPFSPNSGASSAPELIPAGTLAWAILTVQGSRQSKETSGTYYNVALTLVGGQYEGRKVFEMIPDVYDTRNSAKWTSIAVKNITRIFESSGWFKPSDPKTYDAFVGKPFDQIMLGMDGQRVAIRIKIEESKDPAYADKNKVGEWLSPNPASGGYKDYQKLIGGQQAVDTARSGAFAPQAAPQAQQASPSFGQGPGWIKNPGSSNAPF